MCWREPTTSCTTTARPSRSPAATRRGVIVTLIADNYFGYCKKEVKTQISYSANLFGNAEEEHAGGALAFASYNLGEEFDARRPYRRRPHVGRGRSRATRTGSTSQPEGYAVDRTLPRHRLRPRRRAHSIRAPRLQSGLGPTAATSVRPAARRTRPT